MTPEMIQEMRRLQVELLGNIKFVGVNTFKGKWARLNELNGRYQRLQRQLKECPLQTLNRIINN